jgi:hypothetical protein
MTYYRIEIPGIGAAEGPDRTDQVLAEASARNAGRYITVPRSVSLAAAGQGTSGKARAPDVLRRLSEWPATTLDAGSASVQLLRPIAGLTGNVSETAALLYLLRQGKVRVIELNAADARALSRRTPNARPDTERLYVLVVPRPAVGSATRSPSGENPYLTRAQAAAEVTAAATGPTYHNLPPVPEHVIEETAKRLHLPDLSVADLLPTAWRNFARGRRSVEVLDRDTRRRFMGPEVADHQLPSPFRSFYHDGGWRAGTPTRDAAFALARYHEARRRVAHYAHIMAQLPFEDASTLVNRRDQQRAASLRALGFDSKSKLVEDAITRGLDHKLVRDLDAEATARAYTHRAALPATPRDTLIAKVREAARGLIEEVAQYDTAQRFAAMHAMALGPLVEIADAGVDRWLPNMHALQDDIAEWLPAIAEQRAIVDDMIRKGLLR